MTAPNLQQRSSISPARAWMSALNLTAPISRRPERLFPTVIAERAAEFGAAPALLSDRECLTYAELSAQANRYARWALENGVQKGDCVGLLMQNRPQFMAIWLGITQAGGVVALLNTNLRGPSLAHCLGLVRPSRVIASAEFLGPLAAALAGSPVKPAIWACDGGESAFPSLDTEISRFSGEQLAHGESPHVTIEDRALYIYTSGTTGWPKAAAISHGRVMQWTHWFAGLMDALPADRLYDCLPMYHSVGGVQAPGAILAAGGSVVLRDKFSARHFWSDIVRWDCTMFQYIGELCRYLLNTGPCDAEAHHRIRLACGNGLRRDIWNAFKTRFRIPRIVEFYAATEGNVSFFNVEEEPGSIGRVPSYLAHRFPAALVKCDLETGQPVRNERGFCVRCAPNETGEALGEISGDRSNIGARYEGYTSATDSDRKILRDVFKPGDAWLRTGDLMRRDERGFFYFVDRIGDTFRWKGENVSTTEVSEAICAFPGVKEVNVFGVALPGCEGRAGMAALVTDDGFDLAAFHDYLAGRLPHYAQPLFLRIQNRLEVTATFKYTNADLVRMGYDPGASDDPLYFNHAGQQAFVPLDPVRYDLIQTGQIRL